MLAALECLESYSPAGLRELHGMAFCLQALLGRLNGALVGAYFVENGMLSGAVGIGWVMGGYGRFGDNSLLRDVYQKVSLAS